MHDATALSIFILDHGIMWTGQAMGYPIPDNATLLSHNLVKYKYRLTSLCAGCYSYRMVVVDYAVFFVFPHSAPCMRLSSHTALPR